MTTIEESIARISSLARSVKAFAHDDLSSSQPLDIHASLQSTLTLLGHKLREKQLKAVKCFSATPSTVRACGGALIYEIWTNLIDNAIDASPQGGVIEIATWNEADGRLAVGIQDGGAAIAPEALPRIFDEFYTTKAQGAGSGLGHRPLCIVWLWKSWAGRSNWTRGRAT